MRQEIKRNAEDIIRSLKKIPLRVLSEGFYYLKDFREADMHHKLPIYH